MIRNPKYQNNHLWGWGKVKEATKVSGILELLAAPPARLEEILGSDTHRDGLRAVSVSYAQERKYSYMDEPQPVYRFIIDPLIIGCETYTPLGKDNATPCSLTHLLYFGSLEIWEEKRFELKEKGRFFTSYERTGKIEHSLDITLKYSEQPMVHQVSSRQSLHMIHQPGWQRILEAAGLTEE